MIPGVLRCGAGAGTGLVLGLATVAHAQGSDLVPPVGVAPADPSTILLLQLLQAGGLPAALALMGWLLGRGGIPIHVRLSDDDRKLLGGKPRAGGN